MSSRPLKSLLVGASGQLGSQMVHMMDPDYSLVTSRRPGVPGQLMLDLATIARPSDAERLLEGIDLDAIYCVAGMTDVEGCESVPEVAHNTNCRGPEMLAHVAHARRIPYVYFSTEYVFDGFNGPYTEEDATNPLSVYGKSKGDGEVAVAAACPGALILRTTVVYGQDYGQKNYIYSLMRVLSAGRTMRVPEDQISTPTFNRDLARATLALVAKGATGVFHLCGPERMDRMQFARTVAEFLGLDRSLLLGMPTSALGQKAPRPLSAGMSIEKLNRLHPEIKMHTLAEALTECGPDLEVFLRTLAKV